MPLSDQDRQELAELKDRFRAVLPERLATIRSCRRVQTPYQGEELKILFRVVHQLAGTGRAFGFDAITTLAEIPEPSLRGLLDGQISLSPTLVEALDSQLDRLCEELARQAPGD